MTPPHPPSLLRGPGGNRTRLSSRVALDLDRPPQGWDSHGWPAMVGRRSKSAPHAVGGAYPAGLTGEGRGNLLIDWKKPFDGLVGMLLFGLLIVFGVAIGLSLGIALDQFRINDAIANLWGGILGAGLGAAGGIIGALTIYEKQRRDQLRALLDQGALLPLDALKTHMMGWSNVCLMQRKADQEGANPGYLMRQCGQTAITLVASIAGVPGLPKPVNDTISVHAMSLRMDIEGMDQHITVLLSTQPAPQRTPQWTSIQAELNAVIEKIARCETALREMI